MLLTNGRIYTMNPANTVVDTLVIRGGRVVFAGHRAEASVPDAEEAIDLGGRAVLPGLVDGHAHLQHLARARMTLNATSARSEEQIARMVAAAAARAAPGEWIAGRGWDQNLWENRRFPSKWPLDAAAPHNPVVLTRVDGHASWVNSAALKAAGIDSETPNPTGGAVVKDGQGEPTGLLIDTAQNLIWAVQPLPSEEQFDRAVEGAIAECLAKGLTGLHEMGVDRHGFAAYKRLLAREGFPFRNYAAVAGRSEETWGYYREHGPEVLGDGRLVVRALKLVADGALGSRGAALHEPYIDDPGNTGLLLLPPEELGRLAREAAQRGFQVCVHAIGDHANTVTLDAFERVLRDVPRPDHRFRVEHAQHLRPVDIPRFKQLGVLPSMQATHCTSDMGWAIERLGLKRLEGAYAWRSLLDSGVVILGGSDFPVEDANPFFGLYASVARRPLDGSGRTHPGWHPEQRMTREEAVRSFTVWNAYGSHQEGELGTLEPGKRADLVVLTEDVFTCPEEQIKHIQSVMTIVDGQIAYRREDT